MGVQVAAGRGPTLAGVAFHQSGLLVALVDRDPVDLVVVVDL
jgi:hypothetical protein